MPKEARSRGSRNVEITGWGGGYGDEWQRRSIHLIGHSAVAGLAKWRVEHSPSPPRHKVLVVGLPGERVPKVAHTVDNSEGGGRRLLVGNKLSVH